MKIHLITIGQKMPQWVNAGYDEYAKRLPRECELLLKELPLAKRSKSTVIEQAIAQEGEQMLKTIPKDNHVIALEVGGKPWSTEQLATQLKQWLPAGRDISLLIGGPDGLAPSCRDQAAQQWSLSPLTLPHPLVRIVVAEQLYRAWSLLNGHPYHRA